MVQLSTAGQALVGWFSPPPEKIGRPDLRSWPVDDPDFQPSRAGAFVVDTRSRGQSGDWVMWWEADEPRVTNSKDPHTLLQKFGDPNAVQATRFGGFRIEDQSADPVITLRFDPKATDSDRFKRYHASVRLPWSLIAEITDQPMRDLLLVEHVQPLPPSWVKEIVDVLTGKTAQILIEEWCRAPIGPVRLLKLEKIASHISIPALRQGELPDAHRRALLSRVRASLMSDVLTVDSETHTLHDWYALIAAEEAARPTSNIAPFANIEVAPKPGKGFAYVTSYLKVKRPVRPRIGISGNVVGFSLRVRKVPVTFVLNPTGAKVSDKDGVPKISNPEVLEDEKVGIQFGGKDDELLIGFFGDIGVGLGGSFDSGLSESDGRPGFSKKEAGGDVFGGVTFYSDYDLVSEDFDWAKYYIAAVKGPSFKVGNFVGLDVFSSVYHEITLRGNKVLSAVVTNTFEPSGPKLPSLDLLFGGIPGIKKYIEGWIKGKGSGDFVPVSMGFGVILRFGPTTPPPTPPARPGPPTADVPAATAGSVLFDLDFATFRVGADITRDGRYLLECWLATMRGSLTDGRSPIIVDGYTSPEAPRCYNEQLSLARADTVVEAIKDAFKGGLGKVIIVAGGMGELPALRAGLIDPPNDEPGLAAFIAKHRDQVVRWPSWRRVDISVEGKVIVVGFAAKP